MRQPLRPRLLALVLASALALGGLASCSSDGDDAGGGAQEGSITGLLALVSDTPANRGYVVVQRYDVAEDRATAWDEQGSVQDRELTRVSELGRQTGIGTLALMGGPRTATVYGALGFVPSDVRAGITAGQAPDVTEVALVEADEDAVLDAAEQAVEGATREEVDGVDVVRWLDDRKLDPELDTPVGNIRGQAGRVAWTAPGALTLATSDDVLAGAIGAGRGDGDTLADVEALRDVARALDEADAYAATLVGTPLEASPGPRATPEQIEAFEGGALQPYAALGVGGDWGDDGLELVIVLAHDDEEAAEANEAALAEGVADGESARTRQPWSELLADADIRREGTVVVGRFSVESPGLWQQLVVAGEPLLAVG